MNELPSTRDTLEVFRKLGHQNENREQVWLANVLLNLLTRIEALEEKAK